MLKYRSVGVHLLSAWITCLQVLATERSAHSAYCLFNLLNSQHVRAHRLVQDETNSSKNSGKLQCPMSEEHACTRVWILLNFSPFWCFVQFKFAHNHSDLLCPVYWLYYIKTLKKGKEKNTDWAMKGLHLTNSFFITLKANPTRANSQCLTSLKATLVLFSADEGNFFFSKIK